MSDSLQPHGLQSTRLLHPWGFPSKYGSGVLLPSPTNSDTYYYQFNLTQNICYKCCHEVYLRTTYYFENLLWANLLIYVCVYEYIYIYIYNTHTYIYTYIIYIIYHKVHMKYNFFLCNLFIIHHVLHIML